MIKDSLERSLLCIETKQFVYHLTKLLFQVFHMRGLETVGSNHALLEAREQLQHLALLHHDPSLDRLADHCHRHLRHHVQKKAKLELNEKTIQ